MFPDFLRSLRDADEDRLGTPEHLALYSRHQSPHDTASLEYSVHPSVYSQLNVLNNETRLVNLQPGSGQDPILCEVKKVSLYQDDLHYQALSYVWGSSTLSQSINLNGQPHHVTDNLFAALRRLPHSRKSRTLWIDALCIDQSNVLERNAQVKMMQRIYSVAEECIVAIDQFSQTDLSLPHDDLLRLSQVATTKSYSKEAEAKLEELLRRGSRILRDLPGSRLTELHMFLLEPGTSGVVDKRYHGAFSKLALWFSSPWWDRIWVVQETILPVKVSVTCGKYLVSWAVLIEAAEALYNASSLVQGLGSEMVEIHASMMRDLCSKVLQLEASCAVRSHGRGMAVLEVLWTYRHRQATDPRDHIYALCGLLPAHFAIAGITPDYTIGTGEAFIRVTVALIKKTMSLTVLIGAGVRESSKDDLKIPSWTQNWIEPEEIDLHFGPYRYLAANMHSAALSDFNIQGLELPGNFSLEGPMLALVGLEMDTIEKVGGIMQREWIQSDSTKYKNLYRDWFQMTESSRNTPNTASSRRTINYGLAVKKNRRTEER